MKKKLHTIRPIQVALLLLLLCVLHSCSPRPLRALVITGQNNHNWQVSHAVLARILDQSGRFHTDIALAPSPGGDMSQFSPQFHRYDVVVLDYNGERWSAQTDSAFLRYVRQGGGVVVYHAANNAFAAWPEYNRITALGGWDGRDEKSGPYCRVQADSLLLDHRPGPGGSHGQQRSYLLRMHDSQHPITRGLPAEWLHAQDELYDSMRGPANIQSLLFSAQADRATGGSGHREPLVFTVDYGRARIFHLMLGHCGPTEQDNPAMQCVGFQTLLLRGAEWAATGRVTQPVPADFPSATSQSLRPDYREP